MDNLPLQTSQVHCWARALLDLAIADRLDLRRLMIATGGATVVASLAVALLLSAGLLEFWHLAAANLVLELPKYTVNYEREGGGNKQETRP